MVDCILLKALLHVLPMNNGFDWVELAKGLFRGSLTEFPSDFKVFKTLTRSADLLCLVQGGPLQPDAIDLVLRLAHGHVFNNDDAYASWKVMPHLSFSPENVRPETRQLENLEKDSVYFVPCLFDVPNTRG
ncbi:hypothetical protein AYO20_06758 [Fonsecaea nubica]|uniref:Uncharacterized protein n=1 Tax=Fonsecaea nubica TaxID=856822 RepID=A0A178CXY3_9EURO|nr:hypothetical protein AYO20_06758 [Fonsecaea nubica]OAL33923.1 hypothetical protein AYO20_06758 [Fonsecaea nubica]